MRRITVGCALLAAICWTGAAWGQGLRESVLLKIDTFVGAAPDGVRVEQTWKVSSRKTDYQLNVVDLEVLSANALPGDVYSALDPLPVAFQIAGDDRSLSDFKAVGPGQKVRLIGYLDMMQSIPYLMLSSVHPLDGAAKGSGAK